MRALSGVLLLIFFLVSAASAQEFPTLDSEAYCQSEAAELSGNQRIHVIGVCLNAENSARSQAAAKWQVTSGRLRKRCAAEAVSEQKTYSFLERCVAGGSELRRRNRRTVTFTCFDARGSQRTVRSMSECLGR